MHARRHVRRHQGGGGRVQCGRPRCRVSQLHPSGAVPLRRLDPFCVEHHGSHSGRPLRPGHVGCALFSLWRVPCVRVGCMWAVGTTRCTRTRRVCRPTLQARLPRSPPCSRRRPSPSTCATLNGITQSACTTPHAAAVHTLRLHRQQPCALCVGVWAAGDADGPPRLIYTARCGTARAGSVEATGSHTRAHAPLPSPRHAPQLLP